MKNIITPFIIFLTIGLAVWAYSEINATKTTVGRVEKLNRQIAHAESRLRRLNDEWVYQNRPERLEMLSYVLFDKLELVPLMREHFVSLQVLPDAQSNDMRFAAISNTVNVMSRGPLE